MTESMTDEDLMLNAWEELADGKGWYEMPRQYRFEVFEAGWKAASTQPQQWIKCSDRLPTSADGDANRHVWFWSSITSSRPWLTSVDQLAITRSIDGHKGCFWMHTHLKRPEPPK